MLRKQLIRKQLRILFAAVVLTAAPLSLSPLSVSASAAAASPVSDNWTTSLHDVERTGASDDTNISTSTAATLTRLWSFQTGGVIASQVTVVGGTAYFGSWDGYEYAVNATTGSLEWKTFTGITTAPAANGCNPPTAGISSAATISNGVLYVGGGDAYWYAMNATTGAVLWRVLVGDPAGSGYDGHYNWSSPLIYGGYAYVGVASFGDCPLVQGQLIKIDLSTGAIANTLNLVPNGQIGGGIWTSPALNPATDTIFTATGTETTPNEQWGQAVLAINANTLEVTDSWKLPETEAIFDSDFGTSTTLFTDSNGDPLVGLINKNGYGYAFNQNSLSSGPIWQDQIAVGGDDPTGGLSSVSSAAFGNGTLFMAGGAGVINGVGSPGTVSAIDPGTGAFLWRHAAPGIVIGALTYDNGMVFDGGGSVLEVLDATTGDRLYSYNTGSVQYAAPSIADGVIYTGNYAGVVSAFALPSSLPPSPPPDPNCPTGFTCQDIGSPSPAGSEAVVSGQWTVDAGGGGIGGTSDSFRLMSEPSSGDTQVTAQVASQQPATSQAGVMIRQTSDPGSPYYAVLSEPGNTVAVEYRKAFDGPTTTVNANSAPSLPLYVMIQRVGDAFTAATSTDGSTYTLVPGSDASLPLATLTSAGLAVSSGAAGSAGTATIGTLTIGTPGSAPLPAPSPSPCPSGWGCQDVGNPVLTGDQSLTGGTWTLDGAGAGIDNEQAADQFHFAWKTVAGDGTVSAQVASQTDSDPYAAAGVMMRGSTAANAPYYGAFLTPGNGITVQYRNTTGLESIQTTNPSGEAPAYLEIARSGSAFTTYTSPDGTTWTPVDISTVSLPNLSGSLLGGLAVSSNAPNTMGTATFTSVSVTASAPPPPDLCPTTWSCEDIGVPALPGNQMLNDGTWTVQASGGDIWDTTDQFRLVAQPFEGNGSVSAQVVSQTFTDPYAKSGVMIRLSEASTDPYYGVFVTPQNGVVVQYRTAANGFTAQIATAGVTPDYLEVTQSGTTFTAYTSSDGINWQPIAGSSASIPALTGTLLAGMAVCSHNSRALNSTVFDNVSVTSTGIVGLPSVWTDQDIGGATPSGSATFADNVYTVNGGGNDIWGTNDQFNYVSQPLSGDGTIIAQVASQSNTDPWAKSGVIIKQSTTAGSPYAFIGITPGNGVTFQYGYDASTSGGNYTSPSIWVRLDRQGTVITGYRSNDGVNWTKVGQAVIAMSETVTVGLAVTSHNPNVLNTTDFTDVSVTPLYDGPLPAPWTNEDIGDPGVPGSAGYTPLNGTFTVNGSGNDIWGNNDQFQYVNQPLDGDGTIIARVVSQGGTDPWAKSGIMIKQSDTAGAPYALLAVTPGNGVVLESDFDTSIAAGSYAYPEWLSLQRVGNTIVASDSPDGVNWTEVGTLSVTMTTDVTVGLAVCSHNNGVLNTTTFDSVSVTAGDIPVPPPWTNQDIGGPFVPGSSAYANGTFTVTGSGNDIWGNNDQFQYVNQPLTGDGTITAEVTSQQDTDPWAKSGIMIKQSDTAGAPYALLAVTPGNGIVFQSDFDSSVQAGSYAFPNAWLRLQMIGTTILAYDSPDGVNWTLVGSLSLGLTSPVTVGLAVCSHNNGVPNTSTFTNVSVTAGDDALPSPWTNTDVGSPNVPGSAGYTNGIFTVNGSGSDIWGTADQFQYVDQALTGDGTITARVTSQTGTDPWAKAGIMIKHSTTAGAPYALLAVTPGNGVHLENGFNSDIAGGNYTFPNAWLELNRTGDTFTAYTSPDGSTWTEVGSVIIPMATDATVGLFVCSHSPDTLGTATFANVTVTPGT